jgi:hypothetical protein
MVLSIQETFRGRPPFKEARRNSGTGWQAPPPANSIHLPNRT